MQPIDTVQLLSLSPVLTPIDICIILLFSGCPHSEVRKSRAGIAYDLNIGDVTVYRSIKRLEALALLSVKRFPGGSKVNEYRLDENRLSQLIRDIGDFVAFEGKEKDPFVSGWLISAGYMSQTDERPDLFKLVCSYPSFQMFSEALESAALSETVSDPLQPSLTTSDSTGPRNSENINASATSINDDFSSDSETDPAYITLDLQIRNGTAIKDLFDYLKKIKMLSPHRKGLNIPHLKRIFPLFQDLCDAFKMSLADKTKTENQSYTNTDGLNIIHSPQKSANDEFMAPLLKLVQ
jgi:hypothetical protein